MVTRRVLVMVVAVVALVGGLAGAAASQAVLVTFSDVPESHPFHDEIAWAAANQITEGYGDGTFRPGAGVSRQASVAFLSRYNDKVRVVESSAFIGPSDTSPSALVSCPAGLRAVAGGGYSFSPFLAISSSAPRNADGSISTGSQVATRWGVDWVVVNESSPGPLGTTVYVWVTCVPKVAG